MARVYARPVTWWATAVEVVSALSRLHRERTLTTEGRQQALVRLNYLRQRWNEIQPSDDVRDEAERLLGCTSFAQAMPCNYRRLSSGVGARLAAVISSALTAI